MTWSRHSALLSFSAGVSMALGLGGCFSSSGDEAGLSLVEAAVLGLADGAKGKGFTTQYAILRDGVVTEGEYRQAYADATECMTRAGMRLDYFELVPTEYGKKVDARIAGAELSDAEASRISNQCEVDFDSLVSEAWNLQQGDSFTPEAAALMRECLSARYDVEASGAETIEDFVAAVGGVDATGECLAFTRARLYEVAGIVEPP